MKLLSAHLLLPFLAVAIAAPSMLPTSPKACTDLTAFNTAITPLLNISLPPETPEVLLSDLQPRIAALSTFMQGYKDLMTTFVDATCTDTAGNIARLRSRQGGEMTCSMLEEMAQAQSEAQGLGSQAMAEATDAFMEGTNAQGQAMAQAIEDMQSAAGC
ncbi:uncharacterized protein DSM5745_00254 [Aspergillus mulundensis]|uniref:Cell wall protein n=1 Tax=Aspergillus mulundensis TaxID=1810919 RepID=A0A3D8T302_9EURO|nr:hypothetical protein DSM5745_00254 [Aspergillus mulundensis]RDW92932.1 hypothetical protein DSM5745_00254 [Aspergillus mulundensis]